MLAREALQLYIAKGVGDVTVKRFLAFARLHGESSAQDLLTYPNELAHHLRLSNGVVESVISSKDAAARLFDELNSQSIFILLYSFDGYPVKLSDSLGKTTPALLFCQGNQNILEGAVVGFCGSRKSSAKGIEITNESAMLLAKKDVAVVSGHASGVDIAAHCSTIINGGNTILAIPEGILKFKMKKELKNLATNKNHLIISQFAPSLPWSGRNAMQRNGLIIGLSEAMVLVESGLTGGTFEAGNETLRLKKPLFVVSYQVPGQSAEANTYFINKGGQPILRSSVNGLPNLYELLKTIQQNRNAAKNAKDSLTLFELNGQLQSKVVEVPAAFREAI